MSGQPFRLSLRNRSKTRWLLDRIDRRDAEAITNRAVRRAAAALHHDVVFAAEIDDVPDDQKIAGEPEPLDEAQFLFELVVSPRVLMDE